MAGAGRENGGRGGKVNRKKKKKRTHNFPIKIMLANHNSIDSRGVLKG